MKIYETKYVVHPTRFELMGFCNFAPSHWQFVDLSDGKIAQVGPIYRSKAELLADCERYCTQFGY